MTKTKKILLAVVAIVFVGLIAVSVFDARYNRNESNTYGVVQEYVELPITAPIMVDTTNWKTYNDGKHGVNIKYPSSWDANISSSSIEVASGVYIEIYNIVLRRDKHTLIIGYTARNSVTDKYYKDHRNGHAIPDNINDYTSYLLGRYTISRSNIPEFEEEGGKLLSVCYFKTENNMVLRRDNICNEISTDQIYIGFLFERSLLDKENNYNQNIEFDGEILKEMDSILQNISI